MFPRYCQVAKKKNAYNRVEFERGNISRKPKRKRQGKRVELGGVPISLDVIKESLYGHINCRYQIEIEEKLSHHMIYGNKLLCAQEG